MELFTRYRLLAREIRVSGMGSSKSVIAVPAIASKVRPLFEICRCINARSSSSSRTKGKELGFRMGFLSIGGSGSLIVISSYFTSLVCRQYIVDECNTHKI